MPIENVPCPHCGKIVNFAWVSQNILQCEKCQWQLIISKDEHDSFEWLALYYHNILVEYFEFLKS